MEKYSLIGINGNALAVMGYTARALEEVGLGDLVDEMRERATASNYFNLLVVCKEYIDMANEEVK